MWIDGCVSPIADQADNDLRVAISWTESRSRKRHVGFSGNLENSGHSGSDPIAEIVWFEQLGPMRSRSLSFGACVAALLGLASCAFFQPAEEVIVPLDVNGAAAHIQVWGNTTSEGRYEVVVTTKLGSAQHELWENWGPARRASLYLSLDDRLVVLGGGGSAEMFDLSRDTPPRWIPYDQRPKESGDDWQYLGAVDGGVDELTFYPPSVQPECIPLYGAGSSPYRRSHHDERSCALPIPL